MGGGLGETNIKPFDRLRHVFRQKRLVRFHEVRPDSACQRRGICSGALERIQHLIPRKHTSSVVPIFQTMEDRVKKWNEWCE